MEDLIDSLTTASEKKLELTNTEFPLHLFVAVLVTNSSRKITSIDLPALKESFTELLEGSTTAQITHNIRPAF